VGYSFSGYADGLSEIADGGNLSAVAHCKGLDKKGVVSTVLISTVDTGSERVFTWGLAAETHAE
jgi:hypothetical protein